MKNLQKEEKQQPVFLERWSSMFLLQVRHTSQQGAEKSSVAMLDRSTAALAKKHSLSSCFMELSLGHLIIGWSFEDYKGK